MALTLSGTNGVVGAGFTLDPSGASVTAGVGTFGTVKVSAGAATGLDVRNASGTNPLASFHHSDVDTEGEFIRVGRTDLPTIRYHSLKAKHSGAAVNNHISFNVHDGGSSPYTSQAEVLKVLGNGNVSITDGDLAIATAGHGIDFSAQTVGSESGVTVASELLDHYEEGRWTPDLLSSGSAVTYSPSSQLGSYTRIGRLITLTFYINWPSIAGSPTGYFDIGGLPYTPGNSGIVNLQIVTGSAMVNGVNIAQGSSIIPYLGNLATAISMYTTASGAGWGRQTLDSSYHDGGSIIGGITYFTS